ncbi:MAG: 3-oxo-4,17-pregnadiene-20-carboxyl-CoA hydratase beta subunit [Actinomycetota bacterium]|jgi:acyl dehydratase|nr:3-oxo-4,17-pregnadiene-20-carboxyl-CoA hydratase beta subunit [Actinomycetota bacterium]
MTATTERADVQPAVGDELPALVIEASVRNIVSTAIATRDYQDVHHDIAAAQERGSKTIFTNILTSNGYCIRFVTGWTGPDAVVKRAKIRLGVPNYAGDTMTMTGSVTEVEATAEGSLVTVSVRGANSLGDHVTGTVTVLLPSAS